jgi:hypothetical protein
VPYNLHSPHSRVHFIPSGDQLSVVTLASNSHGRSLLLYPAIMTSPLTTPIQHIQTVNKDDADELDYLSSATLTKRKDFIDREEEARGAPNRVLYYRRNADSDRLITACTRKLEQEPRNVRALLIRATSYLKKGRPSCRHTALLTQPRSLKCLQMQSSVCSLK